MNESERLQVGLREMNKRPSVLQENSPFYARVTMICIVWAVSSVG